jgi:tocopherol O-methyltransferase
MPSQQEIIDYYKFSKLDYRLYNGSFNNLSMHYGIWDDNTRSHREALINENRVVANSLGITADDIVIDLGCGYGSTAVWLANTIGCRVVGITISGDQVRDARILAHQRGVDHLVTFECMDFHRTRFAEGTFDVAIAIESVSHSKEKLSVLREALRILKPRGRLGVADGYFAKRKDSLTSEEQTIAYACFRGVHVPPVPEKQEFRAWLLEAGFSQIRWIDKTASILPTARRVHLLGRILLPISRMLKHLGVRVLAESHMIAFVNQYYAFHDGLGAYGLFVGRKPVRIHRSSSSSLTVITHPRQLPDQSISESIL